jgi:hypothetical protein
MSAQLVEDFRPLWQRPGSGIADFIRHLEDTCGVNDHGAVQAEIDLMPYEVVAGWAYAHVVRVAAQRAREGTREVERRTPEAIAEIQERNRIASERSIATRAANKASLEAEVAPALEAWKATHDFTPYRPKDVERVIRRQTALLVFDLKKSKKEAEDYRRANPWGTANLAFEEAIAQFKKAVQVEWTMELLNSGFVLPDGTTTTWGQATIDQHIAREEMFTTNALANMEGAARHRQAIERIQASGVTCLAEVPNE